MRPVVINIWHARLGLALGLAYFLNGSTSVSQDVVVDPLPVRVVDTAKESKVKAVYLYSIGRFTKWPLKIGVTNPEFTIGVVGESGVNRYLNDIAKKRTIHDRKIAIRQFDTVQEIATLDCEIIFLSRAVPLEDVADFLVRYRDAPVLIVTESPDRPPDTIVNFVIESAGVHLEINNLEAQRKQLAMDARLLRQGRLMNPSSQP